MANRSINVSTGEVTINADYVAPSITQSAQERTLAVKTECRRRILNVADEVTQINLAAQNGAGKLTTEDAATFSQSLDWVRAMQAACVPLITNPAADYTDDSAWPAVPAGAVELAARF